MFRPVCFVLVAFFILTFCAADPSPAQMIETIGSEHISMRLPSERESLGRDLAAEIERCYVFMNRSTGQSLPRKILINITWEQAENRCNRQNSMITVGMGHPSASADMKGFLRHNAAKEIARLGLLEISAGAQREDTEFLFEGMVEILVREYEHSSRSLEGAWVISRYLDDMKLLGIAMQRSWTEFSSGKRCFRNAAPGITLLTIARELQGRDAPLKLFESLKRSSLTASLAAVFKGPVVEAENAWLKKVREYQVVDEITINESDAPQLLQTALVPGIAKPGSTVEMQLYFRSRKNNLQPEGVFIRDERNKRVLQAQWLSEKANAYFLAKINIDRDCPAGEYRYQVTAIDESGNLRNWTGTYQVSN
jgi:hypothetical protein